MPLAHNNVNVFSMFKCLVYRAFRSTALAVPERHHAVGVRHDLTVAHVRRGLAVASVVGLVLYDCKAMTPRP